MGQSKEDSGVWLIERMLFWDEEDYAQFPQFRQDQLARLRRTIKPKGCADLLISARYQHVLDSYYGRGNGLLTLAELWNTNTETERHRLRRARERLFLVVRSCL